MKKYFVNEGQRQIGEADADTAAQAAFFVASASVETIGFRSVELAVTDGETRTNVKLEPKIWYQVAEVSDPIPIAVA